MQRDGHMRSQKRRTRMYRTAPDTPPSPLPDMVRSGVPARGWGGLFGAIFTRNRLICLRPLPSITAASLGEKVGSGRRWHSA